MIRSNIINLKAAAIKLRQQGLSYSEIQKQLPVAKATLSNWFQNLQLAPEHLSVLQQKRTETLKRIAEQKLRRTAKEIEAVQATAAKAIGKISKRELWLMGLMLYWRERLLNRNDSDLRKGVRFSSSDPFLINLFLKWLHDIGGLAENEIDFDLFVSLDKKANSGSQSPELKKIISFWALNTGFHPNYFNHVYYQKKRPQQSKRKIVNKSEMGLLRVRVKASSLLARQISGWIEGIKQQLLME